MPDGQFISPCWKCKCEVWLPTPLYKAAKHSSRISFFCPYGHEAIFSEGETEADKLRRERDRLVQQMAKKDDDIKWHCDRAMKAMKDYADLKASSVKARKRSAAGTCPCCHRTFRQMALHMAKQHPEFKAEEAA